MLASQEGNNLKHLTVKDWSGDQVLSGMDPQVWSYLSGLEVLEVVFSDQCDYDPLHVIGVPLQQGLLTILKELILDEYEARYDSDGGYI